MKIKFLTRENKERIFAAAGLIAVNKRNGKVLVGKRSEKVKNPGVWVFPGGKVERKEPYRKAALREFNEETWYNGSHNDVKRVYMQPGSFNYYMYIGMVKNFDYKMDKREFEIMEWVDVDTFINKYELKHPRLKEALENKENVKRIKEYIEGVI